MKSFSTISNVKSLTILSICLFLSFQSFAQQSRVKKIESEPPVNEVISRNEQPKKDYLMHLANNRLEDVSKRTKYSKTINQGNGHFDLYQSSTPIHYSDNGEWKDINPRIDLTEEGFIEGYKYSNVFNSFKSYYPEVLSNGLLIEFGNEMMRDFLNARIVYENGNGIEISSLSINGSAFPVKDKETSVRYDDVYPSINLRAGNMNSLRKTDYIIENNSFLENIPEGVNNVIFEENFELPVGWTAVMKNQKIMILDESHNYVAHYETPKVFEQTLNDELPNSPNGDLPSIGFDLKQNGTLYALRILVDIDWLTNPNRTFPIVIDPDVTVDETSYPYTYNNVSNNIPKSIPINISSTASVTGVVTDFDTYVFDGYQAYYGYSVPVMYFEDYNGHYSYAAYPYYAPLTTTAASGTSNTYANGSVYSTYFISYTNTAAYDCETVNQNFTYTIGNTSSIKVRVGWSYYTKISYVDLSSVSASSSASAVCEGGTVNLSSTPSSTTADASLPSASCSATGSTGYQTSVTLFNFDDLSGEGIYKSTPNQTNAYEDFTATSNGYANVQRGGSYTMGINVNTDGGYTVHGFVWIDWNNDGDFTDAGEDYDMGSVWNVANGATSAGMVAVSVPNDAAYGYHRIRVGARYGSDPTPCATGIDGEFEDYSLYVFGSHVYTHSWSSSPSGLSSSDQNPQNIAVSENTTYTVSVSSGGCSSTADVAVSYNMNPVAGTVAVTDLSVSGNSDITEAIEADAITWTNSGTANGTIQYFYEWTDNSGTSPTGAWTAWVTSNPNIWNANSSQSNMNRTLWVKTITTSSNGCGTAESNSTWIDVRNCRANTTSASVSAGTVANMPFGETITYTSGTPGDGSFERFQFQWGGTSGTWSDWSTSNPNAYTTDINAGQTLYVRSKIVGASVSGSATCTDYSNTIQTFLIDCANTVATNAGSDVDLCNGNSVALSGSGSGSNVSSYAWSPNTEISSTSSATPTISATSTRTYTLTNTHDNGCTSTDDIVVTVADGPSITTATDLTAATNTCGETELTISHSGTGGNGQWTYSGGLVSYNNSNATDATINVTPQPSDVNTDITMTWTVGAGEVCDGAIATKTIRFNQPTSISSPDTYCYLWGGLTSTDNATGSNWYKWDATKSMWARQSAAPSASTDKLHVLTTDNNCIHASNTMTLGTTTLASLNVGSGASMSLGSGTVTLNGDLTNAGTINEGSGTVSLTATGDQTLSGGGTTNFNNLNLNKTSDNLVLSSPATIKGTLTMNKGNINNGSNILTIGESSASPGAITHNSGSVTGKLRRYFADASSSSKFFPIGNASTTRDVTVSFGSTPGSNQFLTASYNAGYPQLSGADLYAGLPLTTADGQLIQNYDDEGYWEINPGSTATGTADSYSADINSAAYNLTIHMNGLTGANSASMDRTKVRIIKSAGPSHTSWVALTHGSISGSVDSDYTVTASGTGFSFFGAGTEDDNALPVELISFNGVCNEGVVDLVWQTASEQNSEDFEVAYSRDGVDWKTIHTEPAAGFSNTLITYDYTHEGAVSGNNYYRLTQNDIDGASVVYDNLILNANCQTTSEGYFSVFPNPSSGTFQVIMNNESLKGAANINMVDTKGNIVFTKPIEVNSGINMYVIQKQLSPGIYYIHIENGTMRTTVVKHSIR